MNSITFFIGRRCIFDTYPQMFPVKMFLTQICIFLKLSIYSLRLNSTQDYNIIPSTYFGPLDNLRAKFRPSRF